MLLTCTMFRYLNKVLNEPKQPKNSSFQVQILMAMASLMSPLFTLRPVSSETPVYVPSLFQYSFPGPIKVLSSELIPPTKSTLKWQQIQKTIKHSNQLENSTKQTYFISFQVHVSI